MITNIMLVIAGMAGGAFLTLVGFAAVFTKGFRNFGP
jgi:hypothetical protein